MNEQLEHSPTFRLFALPSVLQGIGSILDLGGVVHRYATSPSGAEADSLAIRSDWEAIGQDLRRAVEKLESEVASGR